MSAGDSRPRVALAPGHTRPEAPVSIHRPERGLYIAVYDPTRATPADADSAVAERFGPGGYLYTDLSALTA